MKTGQFSEYSFADIITRYKYEVELCIELNSGHYAV